MNQYGNNPQAMPNFMYGMPAGLSYNNNGNGFMNNQMPNPQMSFQQPQQIPQQPIGLNGKFVDGKEVVAATEVPMGGYGIFPTPDLSTIYAKWWTKDGKTEVATYTRTIETQETAKNNSIEEQMMEQINAMQKKLDMLLNNNSAVPSSNNSNDILNGLAPQRGDL